MRLNVGCGADPWGDIRLDIHREYLGKNSSLNIVGDMEYLPFKDDTFEEVRAYHVLEHVVDWKRALVELMRTGHKVRIKIPKDTYFLVTFLLELSNFSFLRSSLKTLNFPKRRREHIWGIKPANVIEVLKRKECSTELRVHSNDFFKPLGRLYKFKDFLPKMEFEYEIIGRKA